MREQILLTGSQAYGKPTEKSDVDIVVYCPTPLARRIFRLLGKENPDEEPEPSEAFPGFSVKQGKLNLILATTREQFEAWQAATQKLEAVAPCEDEQVLRVFRKEWYGRGFPDKRVVAKERG